ncbi:MAG: RNA-binding transcriptional accessory protein, partial [Planctomycetaceae bacterium]|nr:RNA-binding transcriptional accessory protein [Planctomycetaceae bacterium]
MSTAEPSLIVEFDPVEFSQQLARDLNVRSGQVQNAVRLLDEGNTLPFIARYRKEMTSGLDEKALRAIEDSLLAARELVARKSLVLRTIHDQGKLTSELRQQIQNCRDRHLLEELYLPYRPKRRTRAQAARERGLEPLAEVLLAQQPLSVPRGQLLQQYIDPELDVPDEEAALQGACDIVAEIWAEDPAVRRHLQQQSAQSRVCSIVKRGKREEADRFEAYFDFSEPVQRIPSHRFLAMQRGEAEGFLRVRLQLDDDSSVAWLKRRVITSPSFPFHRELLATADDCYQRLLQPAVESWVLQQLKQAADTDAIAVFAANLRERLLAAPAGTQVTIGIDPGYRTGCKVAVVDATGRFVAQTTIYPTPPRNDLDGAADQLLQLIQEWGATLIAIGNGTASRETDRFVSELIRQHSLTVTKVMVNEAGASVYSASELAGEQYPELDVTVRGAISIAHRLQDPLAELVKIDPRSIGVGQYQHDVDQAQLTRSLQREVESCVSSVGVDLNTASGSLLSYVPGIGPALARRIVDYRDEHGRFDSRDDLLNVPRLGRKAWQQAAGFLRIRNGRQPLDDSAVHPEQHAIVRRMADRLQRKAEQLVGNAALVSQLKVNDFTDDDAGELTIRDVLDELARPGRDPRSQFAVARLDDSIHEIDDLRPGMKLEGTVTNVTRFGAFVDIGVHQ